MKVAFDLSTVAFQNKTGTGVYCEELVTAYGTEFPDDLLFHTYRFSRRVKGRRFLLPLSRRACRETIIDPWTRFKGYKYDLFHGLNSRLPKLDHCKKVATIHDLFSIFGEFADSQFRADQAEKISGMIKRADHIIVPASYTKNELISKMHYDAEKISVIPLGVRALYLKDLDKVEARQFVASDFGIHNPYLLFVGTLEKRKNLTGLIETYNRLGTLLEKLPDLVLVGHEGFRFEEIKLAIEKSPYRSQIKLLGFVNEKNLAHLYSACEVFTYLSLEEGFGIPVIEAMACGVAVLTSNTTSLPEAGGGFTWLVSPKDPVGAAEILKVLLIKDEAVLKKIDEAKKYARSRTWERVASETRSIYSKVLAYSPS